MNEFIAYGGGVGSTTLILKKLNLVQSGDLEVVFVDHRSDLPATYDYVKNIQDELDIDISIIKADSLYDFCWQHKVLPSIHWRWCTDKFKIRPMKKYVGKDTPQIGLSFDERWRARDFEMNGKAKYPLIQQEITKFKALKEFQEVTVPCKSGCFFCPFQKKESWRKLFFEYPYLFMKAMLLEDRARGRNPNIWLYEGLLRNLNLEFNEQRELIFKY